MTPNERPSHIRLALLVIEGYIYLALIIGVFVGAVVLLAWGVLNRRPGFALLAILIGVPVTVTAARAIYALFFTVAEPTGIAITTRRGARLHAMVQDVRQQIGAPRIHRILVTAAFNASALQLPRVGIFWPRNTLLVGYPLLATLSREQIRAVIAHELGHITHAHGRFTSWVHRTRRTWERLLDELDARQATPAHVRLLFRWYVPRLHAESVAVSRQQELLADRLAAEVTGAETTAQALVAIGVGGEVLSRTFWPPLLRRVEHDPVPPRPYSTMGPGIWRALGERDQANLLDQALRDDPEPWGTHPSLRERLARLGQRAQLPAAVQSTAAEELLAAEQHDIAGQLDDDWSAAHAADWRAEHDDIRGRRTRLAELEALEQPTPPQIFERAALTERTGHDEGALALYRAAFAAGHSAAGLAAGRILLDQHDESGVEIIETAMDADPVLVQQGCAAIATFLEDRGRAAAAHPYRVRHARAATLSKMAAKERSELTLVDRFVACSDPAADAQRIASCLAAESAVVRAFLASKELRYSTGTQTLLALTANGSLTPQMLDRLKTECGLSEEARIVVLGRHDQQIEAALAGIRGALVYERRVGR